MIEPPAGMTSSAVWTVNIVPRVDGERAVEVVLGHLTAVRREPYAARNRHHRLAGCR
jgi:hypothetical protein